METDGPSRSSVSRSWQRGSYRNRSGRRRKRRKLWGERIADWTRALIAFLFSNVGIVCLVVGYTIAGAILFTHIEGTTSPDVDNVTCLRQRTAATLWELTSKENVFSEKIWKAKVRDILETYQTKVVTAIKNGYTDGVEGNGKWNFAVAFLYSLTVITTIGYGNIYPKTKWGKVVTIVYAIIGMPLFLLYLSNIGDILARSFKWTYARCCLCKCRRKPYASTRASEMPNDPAANRNRWQMVNAHSGEVDASSVEETSPRNDDNKEDDNGDGDGDGDDDDDDGGGVDEGDGNDEDEDDGSDSYDPQHVTVPLTLCLAIMVGYIWGGAVLFAKWEDWNLLDGSYFCFISLSTIGFGDFVPGNQIYDEKNYFKLSFIFCSMYLMLGMALIAMCFNLMQEEVMAKIRALMRIIKYIFRCDR